MAAAADEGGPRVDSTHKFPWPQILDDLQHRLTRATFNDNLSGSRVVSFDGDEAVIGLRSELVVDWVENRLRTAIEQATEAVAGRPVTIRFVGGKTSPLTASDNGQGASLSETGETTADLAETAPEFTGFHPISSNYTQTPDLFYDWVLPYAHGTVTKLVGAVIRQTIGTFVDKRHNRRREEWPANITVVMKAAGINSRASLYSALWDARADGYLVMREVEEEEAKELADLCGYPVYFTLRLRYQDEPADHPEEERPTYGPKRK
jgi:hypothetical protein